MATKSIYDGTFETACLLCGLDVTPAVLAELTALTKAFGAIWSGSGRDLRLEVTFALARLSRPQEKAENRLVTSRLGGQKVLDLAKQMNAAVAPLALTERQLVHTLIAYLDGYDFPASPVGSV